MRKLILFCCLIEACGSGFGQGVVTFRNNSISLITSCGSPMPGVPNQYYFGLFIAPPGTTDPRAFIFTGVYATNTAQAGIIDGGSGLAVTNWPVGQSMSFLVRGWPASFGHDWATVEPGYCTECLGGGWSLDDRYQSIWHRSRAPCPVWSIRRSSRFQHVGSRSGRSRYAGFSEPGL